MQEKTALNRFGDVILWFGTAILAAFTAIGAFNVYAAIFGDPLVRSMSHDEKLLIASLCFAAGLISWSVFASIAYIFNGRTPVAVATGLFTRRQRRRSANPARS